MIRAFLQVQDSEDCRILADYEFDATPWFKQATEEQLDRLEAERQKIPVADWELSYYAGEQTEQIGQWYMQNCAHTDAAYRRFIRQVKKFSADGGHLAVEFEQVGEVVDDAILDAKAALAARGAVDGAMSDTSSSATSESIVNSLIGI